MIILKNNSYEYFDLFWNFSLDVFGLTFAYGFVFWGVILNNIELIKFS
jgi:hypothetical protein